MYTTRRNTLGFNLLQTYRPVHGAFSRADEEPRPIPAADLEAKCYTD